MIFVAFLFLTHTALLGLPGGSFIPRHGDGRTSWTIVGLIMDYWGGQLLIRNISYHVDLHVCILICSNPCQLVDCVFLITSYTGHFRSFILLLLYRRILLCITTECLSDHLISMQP